MSSQEAMRAEWEAANRNTMGATQDPAKVEEPAEHAIEIPDERNVVIPEEPVEQVPPTPTEDEETQPEVPAVKPDNKSNFRQLRENNE